MFVSGSVPVAVRSKCHTSVFGGLSLPQVVSYLPAGLGMLLFLESCDANSRLFIEFLLSLKGERLLKWPDVWIFGVMSGGVFLPFPFWGP